MPTVTSQVIQPVTSSPYLQIILDKPYYNPGDTGKLVIDLQNNLDISIFISRIDVKFPWVAYIHGGWDGNVTLNIKMNVSQGGWIPSQSVNFVVPSDSRYTLLTSNTYSQYSYGHVLVEISPSSYNLFQNFIVQPSASNIEEHIINFLFTMMIALQGLLVATAITYSYVRLRRRTIPAVPPVKTNQTR